MEKILAIVIFCYIFAALGVCGMLLVRLWWGKTSRQESSDPGRRSFARGGASGHRSDGVLWFDADTSRMSVADH